MFKLLIFFMLSVEVYSSTHQFKNVLDEKLLTIETSLLESTSFLEKKQLLYTLEEDLLELDLNKTHTENSLKGELSGLIIAFEITDFINLNSQNCFKMITKLNSNFDPMASKKMRTHYMEKFFRLLDLTCSNNKKLEVNK